MAFALVVTSHPRHAHCPYRVGAIWLRNGSGKGDCRDRRCDWRGATYGSTLCGGLALGGDTMEWQLRCKARTRCQGSLLAKVHQQPRTVLAAEMWINLLHTGS